MPTNNSEVAFESRSRASFNSITKNDNTFYAVNEPDGTRSLYLGNTRLNTDENFKTSYKNAMDRLAYFGNKYENQLYLTVGDDFYIDDLVETNGVYNVQLECLHSSFQLQAYHGSVPLGSTTFNNSVLGGFLIRSAGEGVNIQATLVLFDNTGGFISINELQRIHIPSQDLSEIEIYVKGVTL